MKKNYSKNISLRCVTCGSDSDFESNDDKTYIVCKKCNREYLGGYSELVELNEGLINDEVMKTKKELAQDMQKEITERLKNAFKGNKYIHIK